MSLLDSIAIKAAIVGRKGIIGTRDRFCSWTEFTSFVLLLLGLRNLGKIRISQT